MRTRTLKLVAVLFAVGAFYFFYLSLNTDFSKEPDRNSKPQSGPTKSPVSGPNYDKIVVRDVIIQDIDPGKGKAFDVRTESQIAYKVFVYDPVKKANRGQLISESKTEGERFSPSRVSMYTGWYRSLSGLREGGKRTYILPQHLSKTFKRWSIPENAMIQLEIELLKIY
ncbi:MAG: hypothetical protein KDD61_07455 [Bdellovibrionales bacterium]|nr:hypothetical protein [Bdellovibrionales bacterium]